MDRLRSHSTGFCFVVLALIATGCQQPAEPEGPTVRDLPKQTAPDALWDDAVAVLREHGFRVRVQDRVNGQIITDPETSAQFWEPWRDDVGTQYGITEASLHTMQRQVTVQFQKKNANDWAVDVRVDVYRLSQPETQITTASSVLHGFSGYLPDEEGGSLRRTGSRKQWVLTGRDGELEQELIRQIAI